MECTNCGNVVPVRKSLQRGKSDEPKKCPTCGETLDKSAGMDGNLIQK